MHTISAFLGHDHAHCDALFRSLSKSVQALDWEQARQDAAVFDEALERHLSMEEQVVFPVMEKVMEGAAAQTAVLRFEHERIRAVLRRLVDAVYAEDRSACLKHADALLLLMHQHSEKEDGVLYPAFERIIANPSPAVLSVLESLIPPAAAGEG